MDIYTHSKRRVLSSRIRARFAFFHRRCRALEGQSASENDIKNGLMRIMEWFNALEVTLPHSASELEELHITLLCTPAFLSNMMLLLMSPCLAFLIDWKLRMYERRTRKKGVRRGRTSGKHYYSSSEQVDLDTGESDKIMLSVEGILMRVSEDMSVEAEAGTSDL
ncbi:hypothetical protein WG66_011232 [Moniliophthora roreri]|nr:hypothetical protein WG66_011232 [Moniliophthora roreri]